MPAINDPRPSEREIRLKYARGDRVSGFSILSCTGEIYDLTWWENYLIRNKLITFQSIDRRLTRIARFERKIDRLKMVVSFGDEVVPELDSDPATGKPVLITSTADVYRLNILERIKLRFGMLDIQEMNEKAIHL